MKRIVILMSVVAVAETYQKPPREILEVMHAPAPPMPSVNPPGTHVLLMDRILYPSIAEVSAPMLRLAGLRINPNNSGPHLPWVSFQGFVIKGIEDGVEVKVTSPSNARLGMPVWSPDGQLYAVANTTPSLIELYVGSVRSPALKKIGGIALNDTVFRPIQWLSGSKELLVLTVPGGRGKAPAKPAAPMGPNVQESAGKSGPIRTYQDMLASPHDESLFEYYAEAQVAIVEAATGKVSAVGKPAIFSGLRPAPDGQHLLVQRIQRPFSYVHPYFNFPKEVEVWDRAGKAVSAVSSQPLQDKIPIEGVPTGPRNFMWRPTEPATLLWWEALDGGDPKNKAPHRDKLVLWKAPFAAGGQKEITRTQHRAAGIEFGESGGLAMVSDYDRDRRWSQTVRIFLDDPGATPKVVFSRNVQDRYKDPGYPLTRVLPTGGMVMAQDGESVFLRSAGATPQGDRPFLDRLSLTTWETKRIFRAAEQGYESVVALLSKDGSRFLTSFETPSEPPNLFVRSKDGGRKALTSFRDPTPLLRSIKRQLVTYKRPDGVQLSFTLFLPPDYKEGTRLPTILWAYPLEYNDADTAGQIGGSTQRFIQMRGSSHLFLLLAGYAILNDATIPIIGSPETVNDTYVEQLVASAKAAIDKAVELGAADRDRVGVSGHSYGGFMTANLLAHSDLFRSGVARSGAYNRSLTPFGFQSERRTFWQARDVYMKMSPFSYADKINEPILLIHGEADNNPGTFPIQSDRLYQAIRGNGGTVRLVMLPAESHGYSARESVEHTVWEMLTWFDKYVKNAPKLASDAR